MELKAHKNEDFGMPSKVTFGRWISSTRKHLSCVKNWAPNWSIRVPISSKVGNTFWPSSTELWGSGTNFRKSIYRKVHFWHRGSQF